MSLSDKIMNARSLKLREKVIQAIRVKEFIKKLKKGLMKEWKKNYSDMDWCKVIDELAGKELTE